MRTRERLLCKSATAVAVFAMVSLSALLNSASGSFTYQIDNGNIAGAQGFQNSLGGEAEDSWTGNTFTANGAYDKLTSISWVLYGQSNAGLANLPAGGNFTYAIYSGTPATGLTLLSTTSAPYAGAVATAIATPGNYLITQQLPTPVTVSPGEQFTAAVLIDNTPSTAFPFGIDNSGNSTSGTHGSFYDIVSTVANPDGLTNTYNIATPYFPVLNGATYIFAPGPPTGVSSGSTNAFGGISMIRVNAVPEPSSIVLAAFGLIALCGYGVCRRRPA